ncbi:MAG: response regulator [Bacteroidota bacterium]
MDSNNLHFIIVDDSKLDCFIAEKVIQNSGKDLNVKSFLLATDSLEFIKTVPTRNDDFKIFLLVDIQMPLMNGFEFLEQFETLHADIQSRYVVYILSSSINENDINKARRHPSVIEFLNKPITFSSIAGLIENL